MEEQKLIENAYLVTINELSQENIKLRNQLNYQLLVNEQLKGVQDDRGNIESRESEGVRPESD